MSDSESEFDENEGNQIVRKTIAIGTGDGPGKVLFASGNQFEGEYRKGLRHGRGIFSFISGARYDGDWVEGLKHGSGKFTYPDGSSYCGDWKQNKKHGFGKYVYENGDVFEGTWKDDKKQGIGTYKNQLAQLSFKASWVEGVVKGPVEIDYGNFRYHGYWNDHDSVGEGVFSFGMKYMLPGHVEKVFRSFTGQSASNESFKVFKVETKAGKNFRESLKTKESDANDESTDMNGECVPRFIAHEIRVYDYSKLPQQPISLPQHDSITSVCTKSSQSDSEIVRSIGDDISCSEPVVEVEVEVEQFVEKEITREPSLAEEAS